MSIFIPVSVSVFVLSISKYVPRNWGINRTGRFGRLHLRIHCRRRRRRNLVYNNIARGKSRGRSQEKGGGSGSEFHLCKFFEKKNINSIWAVVTKKLKIVVLFGRFKDAEWCVALRRRSEGKFFVEAAQHAHKERNLEIFEGGILSVAFSSSQKCFSPFMRYWCVVTKRWYRRSTCRSTSTRVFRMWWLWRTIDFSGDRQIAESRANANFARSLSRASCFFEKKRKERYSWLKLILTALWFHGGGLDIRMAHVNNNKGDCLINLIFHINIAKTSGYLEFEYYYWEMVPINIIILWFINRLLASNRSCELSVAASYV